MEKENPGLIVNAIPSAAERCLFINGRTIIDSTTSGEIKLCQEDALFRCGKEVIAETISGQNLCDLKTSLPEFFDFKKYDNLKIIDVLAFVAKYPGELVLNNRKEITKDFGLLVIGNENENIKGKIIEGANLIGKEQI